MPQSRVLSACILALAIFAACSDDEPGANGSGPVFVEPTSGFEYAGHFYQGQGKTLDSASPRTDGGYWPGIVVTQPTVASFEADGFFVLKGANTYQTNFQYSLVDLTNVTAGGPSTSYWVRGNFEKRIWLRVGAGDYRVRVLYTKVTVTNLGYEGDINGWMYWTISGGKGACTFTVRNTRPEDGTFRYPSDPIQSDASNIRALALALTAGVSGTSNKIRVLHNFVVTNLYYDDASLPAGFRKKQDAVSTLSNKTGVCEGYTSLFGALLRTSGIRARCIAGYANGDPDSGHAWTSVDCDGAWWLVDTTWDDPGPNDTNPSNLFFSYFMKTDAYFASHYHTWQTDRPGRALAPAARTAWRGYPAGSY